MNRALPALTVTTGLLMANSAAACAPSGSELFIIGGIFITTVVATLSAVGVVGVSIWRAVRRQIQARAHVAPLG